MPWVNVNRYDIRYVEQGSGQPMVFLHGNSSCSVAWERQFEEFAQDFRCIAYDSVNHGMSANSPRDEDEPDRADELEGFLAALGIERPILVGNSMGGNTALRYGVRHPDAALALVISGAGVRSGEAAVPPMPKPMDPERLYIPFGASFTRSSSSSSPTSTSATSASGARPRASTRCVTRDDRVQPPSRSARPSSTACRRSSPILIPHRRPRLRPRGGADAAGRAAGREVRAGARRTPQRLLRDAGAVEPARPRVRRFGRGGEGLGRLLHLRRPRRTSMPALLGMEHMF